MWRLAALPILAALVECVAATGWLENRSLKPTPTVKRQSPDLGFVSVDTTTGQFVRNGK